MKASELRIGNYFDEVTQFCTIQRKIQPYHLVEIYQCEVAMVENPYSPVVLNEEWLLKFGFFRHHADYSNGYIMFKNVPFEKEGFTFKLYPIEIGSAEEPLEAQKIKYVHQLQNLYFAIIGYELQIADSAQ